MTREDTTTAPQPTPESPPQERTGVVDCALYHDGVRQPGAVPLDGAVEMAAALDGPAFAWIGLYEPTAEEFDSVAQQFSLHPLAVEDAVHAHQRPKMDVYGDTLFVVLKTVRYVDRDEVIEVGEVMAFVGPQFLVTVRHGPAANLHVVRERLEQEPEMLRRGPAAALYAIADFVVDGYVPAEDSVEEDITEIENSVFSTAREDHAERAYKLKREVLQFQRSIKPLAEPLRKLASDTFDIMDDVTAEYFGDVYDHVLRTSERVDGFSLLLNDILEANTASVSMRQNEDMRKISAWVAIAGWITMIAGIYGMNFEHMPELAWRYGYAFALVIMGAGSVALYRAFKRNGWL